MFPSPFDTEAVEVGLDRAFYLTVPVGQEVAKVLEYALDNRVEHVQLESTEDDVMKLWPYDFYADTHTQWNLFGSYGIGMDDAWDAANYQLGRSPLDGWYADAKRIEIAYIDSGFYAPHEDLFGKALAGWDFVADPDRAILANTDSESGGYNHHGSRGAGIAAATASNGVGIAGVNWRGKVVPIRIFDLQGNPHGDRGERVNKASSLAEVINQSYGRTDASKGECLAIAHAFSKGAVVVSAGGNADDPSSGIYPARCLKNIGVTASGNYDQKPDFTVISDSDFVAAPGDRIFSTAFGDSYPYGTTSGSPAAPNSGTSFAVPHVSGVAQLMLAMGVPNLQVSNAIIRSATPLTWSCGKNCRGRLHAERAMKSALQNGVFEYGTSMSARWIKAAGACASGYGNTATATNANATNGGGHSVKSWCNAPVPSGVIDLYQHRQVSNNWQYRFTVKVINRGEDEDGVVDNSLVELVVCFYDSTDSLLPGGCSSVDGSNPAFSWNSTGWTEIGENFVAPPGAVSARIRLRRNAAPGGGETWWDDAAFYAYGRPS